MKFTEFYKNHLLCGLLDWIIAILVMGAGLTGFLIWNKTRNKSTDTVESEDPELKTLFEQK